MLFSDGLALASWGAAWEVCEGRYPDWVFVSRSLAMFLPHQVG